MTTNPVTLWRERAQWSRSRLAAAAGISPSTVCKVENGGRVSQRTLHRIGAALDINLPVELLRMIEENEGTEPGWSA